jgi:hypothetical protein
MRQIPDCENSLRSALEGGEEKNSQESERESGRVDEREKR